MYPGKHHHPSWLDPPIHLGQQFQNRWKAQVGKDRRHLFPNETQAAAMDAGMIFKPVETQVFLGLHPGAGIRIDTGTVVKPELQGRNEQNPASGPHIQDTAENRRGIGP